MLKSNAFELDKDFCSQLSSNIYFMKTKPVLTRLVSVCSEISNICYEKGFIPFGDLYSDFANKVEKGLERRKYYKK